MKNSGNNEKLLKTNKKGFSLAEILMLMVITCVIVAVALPMLTQSKVATLQKKGTDLNTINCISSASTSSPSCTAILSAARYGDPNVINTLQYYINYGASTTFAAQMMRLSCDNLSTKACDYFINSCIGDTSAGQTQYCDIQSGASSSYDLNYYLTSTVPTTSSTSPNYYIANQVSVLCSQGVASIIGANSNACNSVSGSLACNLRSSCPMPACSTSGSGSLIGSNPYTISGNETATCSGSGVTINYTATDGATKNIYFNGTSNTFNDPGWDNCYINVYLNGNNNTVNYESQNQLTVSGTGNNETINVIGNGEMSFSNLGGSGTINCNSSCGGGETYVTLNGGTYNIVLSNTNEEFSIGGTGVVHASCDSNSNGEFFGSFKCLGGVSNCSCTGSCCSYGLTFH